MWAGPLHGWRSYIGALAAAPAKSPGDRIAAVLRGTSLHSIWRTGFHFPDREGTLLPPAVSAHPGVVPAQLQPLGAESNVGPPAGLSAGPGCVPAHIPGGRTLPRTVHGLYDMCLHAL